MSEQQAYVASTPDAIEHYQLAVAKQAIKLEKLGMTHSRGRRVKVMWANHFGLGARAKHDVVLAHIQARMDFLVTAKDGGITAATLQALCEWANEHGAHWKEDLLQAWLDVDIELDPLLNLLGQEKGPTWLAGVEITP
jgi:hypothetical protein